MGVVYRAWDPELDRRVALKCVRAASEISTNQRLFHEAKALARLNHANIVAVYDVIRRGSDLYLFMEFVEGETFERWIQRAPRWQDIVRVFVAAGRGLVAAHQAGLIHGDFKPANALITKVACASWISALRGSWEELDR